MPVETGRERIAELMTGDAGVDAAAVEDAMRRLHDEGIDGLEALVRRVLARRELRSLVGAGDLLVTALPRSRWSPPLDPSQIRHRVPECRLLIDGVEYDPSDIGRFDGTALHMMAVPSSAGDFLYAFTDDVPRQALLALFSSRVLTIGDPTPPIGGNPGGSGSGYPGQGYPTPGQNGCGFMGAQPCYGQQGSGGHGGGAAPPEPYREPTQHPHRTGTVQLFEHVNYQGDWFWVESGRAYADLREVSRNTVLWSSDDWNDTISSMSVTNDHMLYSEHVHQQGNTLYIPPNTAKPQLVSIGWNDRISSVWNYGPSA